MANITEMIYGSRAGFIETKLNDFTYAAWLRKHKAINHWTSHPPIGSIGVNEHFDSSEKINAVSYAVIDNSMKRPMRVFLRTDLVEKGGTNE